MRLVYLPVVSVTRKAVRGGRRVSRNSLFAVKPIAELLAEGAEEGEHSLKRALGHWSLVAIGIGAIIGAGIFVMTGIGAHGSMNADGTVKILGAGPALVLSFVLAGVALRLRRPLLRGVRLDDPARRLGVHLRLRDARRALRLDHRLGPRSRIHDGGRHRFGRLVGLPHEVPEALRRSTFRNGSRTTGSLTAVRPERRRRTGIPGRLLPSSSGSRSSSTSSRSSSRSS